MDPAIPSPRSRSHAFRNCAQVLAGIFLSLTCFQAEAQTAAPDKPAWPSRSEAVGSLLNASPLERAAFEEDAALHLPIKKPEANDWLARHDEKGQTYDQYRILLPRVKPRSDQRSLVILPLGDFGPQAPSLEQLRSYCEQFFTLPTSVLPAVPIREVPARVRINTNTQKRQLLTTDILQWLPNKKPDVAYAIIAVTMEDLYPDESWNFVFGQALLEGGAGVFSFARYDPAFYGDTSGKDNSALILKRSCKVLTHETGHMFGIKHCVFFECLMNGSNHLGEADAQPMRLCPVCLRKLHLHVRGDLIKREENLLRFYEAQSFTNESDWSRKFLGKLRPHSSPLK
jgi:archaemetzincin